MAHDNYYEALMMIQCFSLPCIQWAFDNYHANVKAHGRVFLLLREFDWKLVTGHGS